MSERRRTDDRGTSRVFNFGEVPLGGHLPEGSYDMKIVSMEQRWSNEKGVLMYTLEFRVDKPQPMFGRGLFETFVFGTTPFDPGESKNPDFVAYSQLNDPECEDPMTLKMSRGVQSFKQIMHFADVDMDGDVDMDDIAARANSGELMVGLRIRVEEETKGRYAGTIRNRIGHVYEIGREEPGFHANPAAQKGRGPRQAASSPGTGRRRTQPENMERALNSTRARRQAAEDLADDLPPGVQPDMFEEEDGIEHIPAPMDDRD